MVNESETEMEMVTLTQNENETLHWILMEILIWNADPHHQTLHLILSPAKNTKVSVIHEHTLKMIQVYLLLQQHIFTLMRAG